MIPFRNTIHELMELSWPIIFISVVVIVSLRITYLYKNKKKFVFYKELLMLSFIIYVLCLFQVVTFQDVVAWSSNNFIPFKEILRYDFGSRLFIKNVLGNMILFMPYGYFSSFYLKLEKISSIILLTLLSSLAIEFTQLMIGRVFDVDDIILNVIGGLIGFFLYILLKKIGNIIPKIFHKEYFLNFVALIVLLGTILILF